MHVRSFCLLTFALPSLAALALPPAVRAAPAVHGRRVRADADCAAALRIALPDAHITAASAVPSNDSRRNPRAIGLHRANAGANHRPAAIAEHLPNRCESLCRLEAMLVDPKSPNPGFERLPRNAQPNCCSERTEYSPLQSYQSGLDPLSLVSCPYTGC